MILGVLPGTVRRRQFWNSDRSIAHTGGDSLVNASRLNMGHCKGMRADWQGKVKAPSMEWNAQELDNNLQLYLEACSCDWEKKRNFNREKRLLVENGPLNEFNSCV